MVCSSDHTQGGIHQLWWLVWENTTWQPSDERILNFTIVLFFFSRTEIDYQSRGKSNFLRFPCSLCHRATTIAPNHYKVINATQCTQLTQQTNKCKTQTNAMIKQTINWSSHTIGLWALTCTNCTVTIALHQVHCTSVQSNATTHVGAHTCSLDMLATFSYAEGWHQKTWKIASQKVWLEPFKTRTSREWVVWIALRGRCKMIDVAIYSDCCDTVALGWVKRQKVRLVQKNSGAS